LDPRFWSAPTANHCYERQLVVNPELEGTVVTSFIVSASGAVLSVEAKGLDPEVDACVARVIQSIEFGHRRRGHPDSLPLRVPSLGVSHASINRRVARRVAVLRCLWRPRDSVSRHPDAGGRGRGRD
jgi:hypothetical protein